MSVTYGAGGGTSTYTTKIAQIVQEQGVTALAHLTCVSSDRNRIHQELDALHAAGIENILALRGDYPEGYDPATPRGTIAMPRSWCGKSRPMAAFLWAGPATPRAMWSA